MQNKLIVDEGNLYKKANQVGQGPSFQQQFGILANAQIADKYPSLGNYLIAVQLLDKSDDNSFAVCIIIYKLNDNYIYVPAIFRNGKIHTGQIMEVPGMQRLLPLSDAWMSWIKNKDVGGEGQLIPSQLANIYGESPASARAKDPLDPIMKTASYNKSTVFDTVLKMGKKASSKLMDLISTQRGLNASFKFYSPQEIYQFSKQAAQKFPDRAPVQIIEVMDKKASLLSQEEKKNLYRDGFVVKQDNRVDWGPADNAIQAIEVKAINNSFTTPDKICKCKVLTDDGQLLDVVYLPKIKDLFRGFDNYYDSNSRRLQGVSTVKWDVPAKKDLGQTAAVIIDGHWYPAALDIAALTNSKQKVDISSLGKAITSLQQLPDCSLLITPSGEVIRSSGGRKTPEGDFVDYRRKIHISADQNLKSAVILQDYMEVPKATRVVFDQKAYHNNGKRDYEVDCFCDLTNNKLVTIKNLTKAIQRYSNKRFKKLKVTSDGQQISISGDKTKAGERFQVKQAVFHLVSDYGICPQQAKTIIKKAGAGSIQSPVCHKYHLIKNAQEQSDMWKPADIGYTSIQQDGPERTQYDLQRKAQQDARDMEAIEKATNAGIKQVFDTQILKLLVHTADPQQEIQQALPDFMNTLNKLCRLLFIYRCHTQDLEERYGAVKMKALEQSLKNTINDLSQLTIFLKLRGLNEGQSPETGDLQTGIMMN